MENKQVKELMRAMADLQIDELELEGEGVRLKLKRGTPESEEQRTYLPPQQVYAQQHTIAAPISHIPSAAKNDFQENNTSSGREDLHVTSPMVGTFYSAASPESDPFVKEGDSVDENTVVCIVEAMKVMNEVKAGVKGIVREVLIEDGHPVEYGNKLIRVEAN